MAIAHKIKKIFKGLASILSKYSFSLILLLFISETVWLVFTSDFPMSFDEGYHFSLIQFFSHHLNPIITSQPSSTYALGNIVHNPSFLYHYLLSFPYRLFALSNNLQVEVVLLRLINVGFAVASLVFLRKIFSVLNVPKVVSNIVILMFALTPLVTALSAQINYDNLVILTVMISVYLMTSFYKQLNSGVVNLKPLLILLPLCLFASLVKYEFVPVFVAIVVTAAVVLGRLKTQDKQLLINFKKAFNKISLKFKLVSGILSLAGLLLCLNYYGVNTIKYHNPIPQCNQVLSVKDCTQYYAWDRNYVVSQYVKSHPGDKDKMSIGEYTWFWFKVEAYQLYAEIIPTGGLVYVDPVFYVLIVILALTSFVAVLLNFRKIFNNYRPLKAITAMTFIYLLFLWSRNFHDYLQLGQPLAIQGRYLVPILAYVYLICAIGIWNLIRSGKLNSVFAKLYL